VNEPFVSVVTPVYNGGEFLSQCIESVLGQTHGNFEYIILNNSSTDLTLEIASEYARRDPRIQVFSNPDFVGVIENHNRAFRRISGLSKYCKVVSADDWLFPECIERMIEVAEAYPSVGIVGSYQLSGRGRDWRQWRVHNVQIAYPSTRVPGRELCRSQMLGGPTVFGAPTALLYRADIVRCRDEFYPNPSSEADWSACYQSLRDVDFGFVHQVLSCDRVHENRQSARSRDLGAYLPSGIRDLLVYGEHYLTKDETSARVKVLLNQHYNNLARAVFEMRGREYWRYHRQRLAELGLSLSYLKLSGAVLLTLADWLANPKLSVQKLLRRSLAQDGSPAS
jgi:glycosyltransferase involved in cell wall biosynthesis